MLRAAAILVTLSLVQGAAGEPPQAEFEILLRELVQEESWRARYGADDSDPLAILVAASERQPTLALSAQALAEGLDLPAAAAGPALEATLLTWQAERRLHRPGSGDEAEPEAAALGLVRRAEAAWLAALEAAPAHPRLLVELAALYDLWAAEEASLADRLLDLWRSAPPEVDLITGLEQSTGFVSRQVVLGRFLERSPGHPVALAELAEEAPSLLLEATLLGEARAALSRTGGKPDIASDAALLGQHVEVLLELGLLESALGGLEAAPAEVLKALFEPGEAEVQARIGGLSWRGRRPDLRLPVIVALMVAGRWDEARDLLPSALEPEGPTEATGPSTEPVPDPGAGIPRSLGARLVGHLLGDAVEDPFALLAEALGLVDPEQPMNLGLTMAVAWRQLAAEVAGREGYPAIERHVLGAACAEIGAGSQAPADLVAEHERLVPGLVRRLEDLAAEVRLRRARLRRDIDALGYASATVLARDCPAEEPVDPRRLPSLDDRYRVRILRRLPVGPEAWESREPRSSGRGAPGSFPAGFVPVAFMTRGAESLVVALGHGFAPWSSAEAYWLVRSPDGGASWGEPLFTGLFAQHPYEVRADSAASRLDGDRLILDVDVWESDEGPAGDFGWPLAVGARGRLSIRLALLFRDRDGDGLTDLAEEALRTDPGRRDTDGDGAPDARDPLPGQAAGEPSHESEAFRLALEQAIDKSAIPGNRGEPSPEAVRPLTVPPQVLVAHAAPLASLEPSRRWVLLAEDDPAVHAEVAWAHLNATVVNLFALDHAGDRALFLWSGAGSFGRLLMGWSDGAWKVVRGFEQRGCIGRLLGPG